MVLLKWLFTRDQQDLEIMKLDISVALIRLMNYWLIKSLYSRIIPLLVCNNVLRLQRTDDFEEWGFRESLWMRSRQCFKIKKNALIVYSNLSFTTILDWVTYFLRISAKATTEIRVWAFQRGRNWNVVIVLWVVRNKANGLEVIPNWVWWVFFVSLHPSLKRQSNRPVSLSWRTWFCIDYGKRVTCCRLQ